MFYENPYFRVTVGNCLTLEEAIILKGRVSGTFPKAFPKASRFRCAISGIERRCDSEKSWNFLAYFLRLSNFAAM